MATSEAVNQAIGGVIKALITNVACMTPEAINQITERVLSAQFPRVTVPVTTSAQLDQYGGNLGGRNRRRSRAIMAQNEAVKKRKDRVKLRPLNAFICFRCKSNKEHEQQMMLK
jgi:hypothetical protein